MANPFQNKPIRVTWYNGTSNCFNSIIEASEKLNVTPPTLRRYLKDGTTGYYGAKFEYIKGEEKLLYNAMKEGQIYDNN